MSLMQGVAIAAAALALRLCGSAGGWRTALRNRIKGQHSQSDRGSPEPEPLLPGFQEEGRDASSQRQGRHIWGLSFGALLAASHT